VTEKSVFGVEKLLLGLGLFRISEY